MARLCLFWTGKHGKNFAYQVETKQSSSSSLLCQTRSSVYGSHRMLIHAFAQRKTITLISLLQLLQCSKIVGELTVNGHMFVDSESSLVCCSNSACMLFELCFHVSVSSRGFMMPTKHSHCSLDLGHIRGWTKWWVVFLSRGVGVRARCST